MQVKTIQVSHVHVPYMTVIILQVCNSHILKIEKVPQVTFLTPIIINLNFIAVLRDHLEKIISRYSFIINLLAVFDGPIFKSRLNTCR